MQTTASPSKPRLAPFLALAALLHAVVILLVPLDRSSSPSLPELRLALAHAAMAPPTAVSAPVPPSDRRANRVPLAAQSLDPQATLPASGPVGAHAPSPALEVAPSEESAAVTGESSAHVIAQVRAALTRYFVYPISARRQGWQGEVLIAFLVTRDGRIDNVEVVRSSGYRLLDEAARSSLARVGSLPDYAARGGEPLQIRMPIIYRLES